MTEARRYTRLVLLGTVVLATALRLAQIGAESLWLDEAYSAVIVQQRSYWWLLTDHPFVDPHPPLFYLLLKPWIGIVGSSPVALRLQSVLFGVGTVVLMYYLGRAVFDTRTGLYGAIFVAVAPVHIWHAQNVRMYAMLAFLTVLSTLALVWLTRAYTRRRIALYVLSAVALGYTHGFGLFVILAQGLYLASRPMLPGEKLKLSTRRWLTVQGLVLVFLLPWAYGIARRALGPNGLSTPQLAWISRPDPWTFIEAIGLFVSGTNLHASLDASIPAWLPWLLGGVAFIFVVGAIFRVDLPNARVIAADSEWERLRTGISVESDRLPALWLLSLLFLVPLIVPYLLSIAVTPILVLRYTIPATIGFYLLVARGARKLRPPPIQVVLVGILLIGLVVPLPTYYGSDQRGQWDQAAQAVELQADEDDLVIVSPEYAWWPFGYYYRGANVQTAAPDTSSETVANWIEGYDRVFLVFRYPGEATRERFRGVIEETGWGDPVTQEYLDVTVVRYVPNGSNATALDQNGVATDFAWAATIGAPGQSVRVAGLEGVNPLATD